MLMEKIMLAREKLQREENGWSSIFLEGEEPTLDFSWVIGEKTELWAQRPEVR